MLSRDRLGMLSFKEKNIIITLYSHDNISRIVVYEIINRLDLIISR